MPENPTDNIELLIEAATEGRLDLVRRLIEVDGIDPAVRNNTAFCYAAQEGHLPVIQYLAAFNKVNPAAQRNYALIRAAANGHLAAVKFLLGLKGVDPSAQNNKALVWAAQEGHLPVVKCLVGLKGVDPAAWHNGAIIRAAENGHLATVEYLVSLDGVNPAADDNDPFVCAAMNGHLPTAKYLVSLDEVDPTARDNQALRLAAERGQLEMVKYLTGLKEVDPADQDSLAFRQAAAEGRLDVVIFLAGLDGVNPAARDNAAIIWAAHNGHLDVVKFLASLNTVNPAAQYNEALIRAAINGHLEIVKHLVELNCVNPADQNNEALIEASANGRLNVVAYLTTLQRVDPTARDNHAIRCAARKGHLGVVQHLLAFNGVEPHAWNNLPLRSAAENGHFAVVQYLLGLEGVNPAAQNNEAIRHASRNGHLEVVRALLADGRVTVQPNDINVASLRGHTEIAGLLEDYLLRSPSGQMAQLIAAHEAVLSYERQRGLSGRESSMDAYLERQAAQQRAQLSELYPSESLSSGLTLLRRLVFTALQSHLEATPSPATEEKRAFLSAHMNDLIAGKTSALSGAAALFNSKEDMYEIASRAINVQAPFVRWSNLLTAKGEAGGWVQSYAGNIAREIAASEGQPHYDTCLYALIYRLAEIRRAHNEGDLVGIDNPSCFPGTKTRLLKILETHPAHRQYVKPEWKMACYEGAVRHIERVFGEALEEMDSSEEAEALLDALLLMRLENKEAIFNGAAIQTTSLEDKVYDESYAEKRLAFVQKVREGLNAAVNTYLAEQEQEPVLAGDNKEVYLRFLEVALGENWVAPRLASAYAMLQRKAPRPAQPILSLRMAGLQRPQLLQALKRRFYEYCEQHYPEVELSTAQVNAFFARAKVPSKKDEEAFFEAYLREKVSQDTDGTPPQMRVKRS